MLGRGVVVVQVGGWEGNQPLLIILKEKKNKNKTPESLTYLHHTS